jgi:hypothetical protein
MGNYVIFNDYRQLLYFEITTSPTYSHKTKPKETLTMVRKRSNLTHLCIHSALCHCMHSAIPFVAATWLHYSIWTCACCTVQLICSAPQQFILPCRRYHPNLRIPHGNGIGDLHRIMSGVPCMSPFDAIHMNIDWKW